MLEGRDGSIGSYSDGERSLLTYTLLCADPLLPLSSSSVLDGRDGTGDSTALGDGDVRVSLSRLELRRKGESLGLEEELGLVLDCSI